MVCAAVVGLAPPRLMREAFLLAACGVILSWLPMEFSDLELAFLGALSYSVLQALKRRGIVVAV
eukprot:CAMPEP_0170583866 /NCGR_PEP_ID=MMETSP0224-20130122/8374_1 /TAXON_ID=285029 /ORGANISM="Togula jolla, Strain CCCM 725" /LENGTH=63 /DNA_ID=CAMNT_0010907243 /DNA_START=79 /DNA_END=270 /DNA_ORIENTATION=-